MQAESISKPQSQTAFARQSASALRETSPCACTFQWNLWRPFTLSMSVPFGGGRNRYLTARDDRGGSKDCALAPASQSKNTFHAERGLGALQQSCSQPVWRSPPLHFVLFDCAPSSQIRHMSMPTSCTLDEARSVYLLSDTCVRRHTRVSALHHQRFRRLYLKQTTRSNCTIEAPSVFVCRCFELLL